MMTEFFPFALLFLSFSNPQPRPSEATIHTVCAVVQHPKRWEGQTISVTSFVAASQHDMVLTGAECGKGIYMSHESGKQNGKWPEFDDALVRKATGLDNRPLKVTVRGIYHSHVPHGTTTIRQLEVLDVLDVSFCTVGSAPSSTEK